MFYFYKEEPQFAMEHFLPFQQQPQRRRTCRRSQLMPSGQPMIIRRVPHQIDVFEHLMNEAEKKVCSEQRHFESVRDYWEAIETVAKAMMNAMEKEETEKPVEEKKSENKENAPEEQPAAKETIKQGEETPIITKAPEEKPVAKKEVVKRFGSKVNVNENMEKVEIVIELIGHKFEGEHLDVAVIDGNVMSVKAEDGDKKFERKFKLPQNANIDKIESKFSSKEEDKQIMTITIPKEVRITQIPIAMEE
jgi:HSP20 family molecular chaperone IbpA